MENVIFKNTSSPPKTNQRKRPFLCALQCPVRFAMCSLPLTSTARSRLIHWTLPAFIFPQLAMPGITHWNPNSEAYLFSGLFKEDTSMPEVLRTVYMCVHSMYVHAHLRFQLHQCPKCRGRLASPAIHGCRWPTSAAEKLPGATSGTQSSPFCGLQVCSRWDRYQKKDK